MTYRPVPARSACAGRRLDANGRHRKRPIAELDYRVVERSLVGIEIGIGPHRAEFRRTDGVHPRGILHIDGIADRWKLAVRPDLP